MVNLKKLIRKTKKPLKANKEVITTFNNTVQTSMTAAVTEILAFGALHGWNREGRSGNCMLLWERDFGINSTIENETELSLDRDLKPRLE